MIMEVPYRLPCFIGGTLTGEVSDTKNDGAEKAAELTGEYIEAGAEVVFAPTEEGIAEAVVTAAGGRAVPAGRLTATGAAVEPFGEVSFYDLLKVYTEQVMTLKKAGVGMISAEGMTTLCEARAAVIAARRAEMTVWVSFACDENGLTENDTSVTAALICLQEMGISAFGLDGGNAEELSDIIEELAAYSKVPLSVRFTPSEGGDFAEEVKLLLDSGADIVGGTAATSPAQLATAKGLCESYHRTNPIEKAETGICLASEHQAFFLEADAIECTEPIVCGLDMEDEFVKLAETNYDVITVELYTDDDALLLSRSAYMASLPVMLRCDDIFVLKTALLTYSGRAMIDSTCGIDRVELETAALEYGAVIY